MALPGGGFAQVAVVALSAFAWSACSGGTPAAPGVRSDASQPATSRVTLCPPAALSAKQAAHDAAVVSERARVYRRTLAQVGPSRSGKCLSATFRLRTVRALRLAAVLVAEGRFAAGVNVRSRRALKPGARVRFRTDPVVPHNRRLPTVVVLVSWRMVKTGTAQLESINGLAMVSFLLRQSPKELCRFTRTHGGIFLPLIIDRRVVSDPVVQSPICGRQLGIPFDTGQGGLTQAVLALLKFGPLSPGWRATRLR